MFVHVPRTMWKGWCLSVQFRLLNELFLPAEGIARNFHAFQNRM
jgi:hypothetical protein